VNASTKNTTDFYLPTWRTDRYEILHLVNDIRQFSAKDNQGQALSWVKTNKHAWQV
jgi:predicted metalloprotease with PDZ domain